MTILRLAVLLFSAISVSVMYPVLTILVCVGYIIEYINRALDAVLDFIDYHTDDQIKVIQRVINELKSDKR